MAGTKNLKFACGTKGIKYYPKKYRISVIYLAIGLVSLAIQVTVGLITKQPAWSYIPFALIIIGSFMVFYLIVRKGLGKYLTSVALKSKSADLEVGCNMDGTSDPKGFQKGYVVGLVACAVLGIIFEGLGEIPYYLQFVFSFVSGGILGIASYYLLLEARNGIKIYSYKAGIETESPR
jgi:hypothetical protein